MAESQAIENEVVVEQEVEEVVENNEPEYTDTEMRAMEKGWNPDKESVPEGKEWIEAGEFLRNESFFTEIRKLKRELNSTKKSFDVLKEHHKKVAEVEREKVLTELKRQKKAALEDEDHAAVVEIDDKIQDVKSQNVDVVEEQEIDNTLFNEWVDRNSWYETNNEMRTIADELGAGYVATRNGKFDPAKLYDHVEKQIKRMYPDEFGFAPKKSRSKPTVEGASASRGGKSSKSKFTERDLNDEQRQVMKRLVSSGVLTKEAYIDELVAIGELV